MPAFYPSCVINLKLSFDESLHVQQLEAPVSTDDTLAAPTDQPVVSFEPLITRRGDQNISFVMNRIPKSGSFELPGYRQAGTFNAMFSFRDLPIDPRTVRSAGVEVHLGAVSAEDFGDGMLGAERGGQRTSVLQTRVDGRPNPDTLVMTGIADEWRVTHGADGSTVELRGRDMRGILLDTPVGTDPTVQRSILSDLDMSLPINELVEQVLSYYPFGPGFNVYVNPQEWPNGVVPSIGDDTIVPRHRRGARGQMRGGRGTPNSASSQMNFWDLIVRFCFLASAIPYFVNNDLFIRPVRSIFDQMRAGGPLNPTPFANGAPRSRDEPAGAAIDPALRFRRLVYGRDTETISFDRKIGGLQRPSTVRVVCVDASSQERGQGRVIQAFHPPRNVERQRRQRRAPGANRSQENVITVKVPDQRDASRLQRIARSIYEEIGRGEIGGNVATKNLTSFGGTNADPDLMRLKPGDGIELMVDTRNLGPVSPLVSSTTDHFRNSFDEQVAEIKSRLGVDDENLARVIVATSRGQVQELQRFFRVSNVKYGWSDRGLNIDFDFQNYVLALFDVEDNESTQQTGAAQRTTVSRRA